MAFPNLQLGPGLIGGGQQPAMPRLPRVPWGQNQAVTGFALGMLGAPNINEGFRQAAPLAIAGMGGNNTQRQFMLAQQEKSEQDAEAARKRAAMNAAIKLKSNLPLTPEEQSALTAAPEVMLQFGFPEAPDAPTTRTVYENGLPVVKQWLNGKWETLGGPKAPEGMSLTVDPDTGAVSFQQGVGVGGAAPGNQPLNRTTSGDIQKQIDDLNIQKAQVERIGSLYDPELLTYQGKLRGWTARQADKLGLSGPEDKAFLEKQTRFVQNVEQVFNLYRKDITGAAAALAELERLKQAVINTDQSPAQFEASIGEFARTLQRGLDIKTQLLREGIPLGSAQFNKEFESRFLTQPAGPTTEPIGGANASEAPPEGVSPEEWNNMTPEERALWD